MTGGAQTTYPPLWMDSKLISVETLKGISSQPWMSIGEVQSSPHVPAPTNRVQIIDHLFYILLVRVVAIFSCRRNGEKSQKYFRASDMDENIINTLVPIEIQEELHNYVALIVSQYRDVHYHSMHHAYHVVVSTNKLLDIVLKEKADERISTFGIKSNPLLQLALVFSALIHDVDHQGISNLQLVEEEDELAIRYNDQSVAEQQSLAIAFQTLGQPKFAKLKKSLFPNTTNYKFFRKLVIDLVLCTDLASPERTQIVKSKWKEAFGETPEQKVYKKILQSEIKQNVLSQSQSGSSRKSDASLKKRGKKNNKLRGSLTSFFDRRSIIMPFKSKVRNGKRKSKHSKDKSESDSDYVSISPCESYSDETPDDLHHSEDNSHPLTLNVGNGRILVSNERGLEDRSHHSIPREAFLSASESSRRFSNLSIPEDVAANAARACEDLSICSDSKHDGDAELNPISNIFEDNVSNNDRGEVGRGRMKASGQPYRRASSNEERNPLSVRSSLTSKLTQEDDHDVRSLSSLQISPRVDLEELKNTLLGNSGRSLLSSNSKTHRVTAFEDSESITSRSGLVRRSSADAALKFSRRSSNESLRQFDLVHHRRKSAPLTRLEFSLKRPSEVRLGIRRAIDLSGNPIEQYPRSTHDEILKSSMKKVLSDIEISDDEPDEFRASVVLETMLRAADISATMQCWGTMLKWSSRLFFEQMEAYESGRMNIDPGTNWFQNQIGFLDSYVIPLARRLDDVGVFGDHGQQFAAYAMENRRQWVEEGSDFTGWMVRRWSKIRNRK